MSDYIQTQWVDGVTPINAANLKKIEKGIDDAHSELATHQADYTLQVPFGGTTTNVGNAYSIAAPAIAALAAGMAISIKCNADSTGPVTLNWNNKGAKSVLKASGTAVTNWKNGGIYTLRYDGTNFILQGEGASGNAIASDLRSGKTASTDAGEIVGTATIYELDVGDTQLYLDSSSYMTGVGWQVINDVIIKFNGNYRVSFGLGTNVPPNKVYAQIYVNDIPRGTQRSSIADYEVAPTFTEDILGIKVGDHIQIYGMTTDTTSRCYTKNFTLKVASKPFEVTIIKS